MSMFKQKARPPKQIEKVELGVGRAPAHENTDLFYRSIHTRVKPVPYCVNTLFFYASVF